MNSKVVNITIPEKLLKEIDRAAEKEGRTRSEFFREATRGYLRNIAFSEPAIEKPQFVESVERPDEVKRPEVAERPVEKKLEIKEPSKEIAQEKPSPPPQPVVEEKMPVKMQEKPKTLEVKPEIYEEPKELEKAHEERTRPKGFFELLNDVLIGDDEEEY